MAILQRLKGEGVGDWPSLGEFLRAARRRDSSALAALGAALGAPPAEQKELAQGDGAAVLLELACDLRAAKAARLAAARCLVETEAGDAGKLFAGAGDLLTDPRLGGSARKLVEKGLPAALKSDGELGQVSPTKTPNQVRRVGIAGAYRNHNYYGYNKYAALYVAENLAHYRRLDLPFLRLLFRQSLLRQRSLDPLRPANDENSTGPFFRECSQ